MVRLLEKKLGGVVECLGRSCCRTEMVEGQFGGVGGVGDLLGADAGCPASQEWPIRCPRAWKRARKAQLEPFTSTQGVSGQLFTMSQKKHSSLWPVSREVVRQAALDWPKCSRRPNPAIRF